MENEYFVQLFLEVDDTQKLPSIGDLMDKMFTEQKISFTEVYLCSNIIGMYLCALAIDLDTFEVADSSSTLWEEISNFPKNYSS